MHFLFIACNKSFDAGLKSAEGQKLECVKWTENNIFYEFYENLVNPLCRKVIAVLYPTQALSICML